MEHFKEENSLMDLKEVESALSKIIEKGQVFEIRALSAILDNDDPKYYKNKQVSGYFDNIESLLMELPRITTAKGIYFIPNPVDESLLARSYNRLDYAKTTTSDSDIISRNWFLVDVDPKRASGIPADDLEREHASKTIEKIKLFLSELGFKEPIVADSGNGFHLMYHIDIPTEDDGLLSACLNALAYKFNSDNVDVDVKVGNPARIWKLYGTLACKGESVHRINRIHRMSKILSCPDELEVTPRECLEVLSKVCPEEVEKTSKKTVSRSTSLVPTVASATTDGAESSIKFIEEFIAKHEISVSQPRQFDGGLKWEFKSCPFSEDHDDGSFIAVNGKGAIISKCQHNRCDGKGWQELKEIYEPDTNNKEIKTSQVTDIDREVEEMNRKYAVVKTGVKSMILVDNVDTSIGYFNVPDFHTHLANKQISTQSDKALPFYQIQNLMKIRQELPDNINSKLVGDLDNMINSNKKLVMKPISMEWIKHPNRRTYDDIEFAPGEKLPSNIYNLWKGFAVEPTHGDWSLLKNHIYDVIADGNMLIGDWIINFMADIIQFKKPKPGVALVLVGDQGIGKNIFVEALGKVLGDAYMLIDHPEQLVGKFNSHIQNKALVFSDEAFFAGDKASTGRLKSMITSDTMTIEWKGGSTINTRNSMRLIFSTNNDHAVPTERTNRRFMIVRVSDKKIGNHDYFDKIAKQLYEDGGLEAMLHDLLNIDLSNVNLKKMPQSTETTVQKCFSDHCVGFIEDFLQSGIINHLPKDSIRINDEIKYHDCRPIELDFNSHTEVKCHDMLEQFNEYEKKNKVHKLTQLTGFTKKLKNTFPWIESKPMMRNGKRDNYYNLKSIMEMRKSFEETVGLHDWGENTDSYEDMEVKYMESLEQNFHNSNGYGLNEKINHAVSETKEEYLDLDKYGFIGSNRYDLLISDFKNSVEQNQLHVI